jgi:hypothetical protein
MVGDQVGTPNAYHLVPLGEFLAPTPYAANYTKIVQL